MEFHNTPLTQFSVSYQPDKKRFKAVKFLHRFETPYRSTQLSLWEEGEVTWLLVQRLPEYLRRHIRPALPPEVLQLPLFA